MLCRRFIRTGYISLLDGTSVSLPLVTVRLVSLLCLLIYTLVLVVIELIHEVEVNLDHILAAISGYLLIAFMMSAVFQILLLNAPEAITSISSGTEAAGDILYFSLSTLSTVGYGDILPISAETRFFAVLEGVTGQFYLAVIVARIIGLHTAKVIGRSAVSAQKAASTLTDQQKPEIATSVTEVRRSPAGRRRFRARYVILPALLGVVFVLVAKSPIGRSLIALMWKRSGTTTLTLERFGDVRLSAPAKQPTHFVIILDDGMHAQESQRIRDRLTKKGAMVGEITIKNYLESVKTDSREECLEVGGEFERMNQVVQKNAVFGSILTTFLLGLGDEAGALAVAVSGQASKTFARVATMDSCPRLETLKPWCSAPGLMTDVSGSVSLGAPSITKLKQDNSPGAACFHQLVNPTDDAGIVRFLSHGDFYAPRAAWNLPIIELEPERKGNQKSPWPPILFFSGDGGWATIDKVIGGALRDDGHLVIGFDSLQYFWRRRSVQEGARMLASLIERYGNPDKGIILIGFSMGADVLPSLLATVEPGTRKQVRGVVLLSASKTVDYEVDLSDWLPLAAPKPGTPILPFIAQLNDLPIMCIYGTGEADTSLCPTLTSVDRDHDRVLDVVQIEGDHHFDGDYKSLVSKINQFIQEEVMNRQTTVTEPGSAGGR